MHQDHQLGLLWHRHESWSTSNKVEMEDDFRLEVMDRSALLGVSLILLYDCASAGLLGLRALLGDLIG